jgi:sugar lactone lactonase YvrE
MKRLYITISMFAICMAFVNACKKSGEGTDRPADQAAFSNARLGLATTTVGTLRVITLAGSDAGFVNATGIAAKFSAPGSVASDAAGNLYIADRNNNMIRKVTQGGIVTTYAGKTTPGFDNGKGAAASFRTPTGVAVDAAGIVYVADSGNNVIRKITPANDGTGEVTTLAGPPTGEAGFTDEAPAAAAQFNGPASVAVDASGTNVYVTDVLNVRIRKIAAGFVSTIAGNGQTGNNPDPSPIPGRVASFNAPAGIAVDNAGNIYLADKGNNRIRQITPAGIVSPAAGNLNGTAGNVDGDLSTATFSAPAGIAIDASGTLYIADGGNNRIRQITFSGVSTGVVSLLAGSIPGNMDGAPAAAQFKSPTGIAVDAVGNVFVADQGNNRIRQIGIMVTVSTLAGNGTAGMVNATGAAAQFNSPLDVALDAAGNIYVADCTNHQIRKITPGGSVITLAGIGPVGFFGGGYADGPGNVAQFKSPSGVVVDASGNVYVADQGNNRIRKITPAGNVSTLAGNGTEGYAEGTGTAAMFRVPADIAVDASGNVYVTDRFNHRIRKITPSGVVSTLAGIGTKYTDGGFADGPGTSARFNYPIGIAVDVSGNVYVADFENQRIRKITPAGNVSTLAGSGTRGYANGPGNTAQFNQPTGIDVDASGNVYVVEGNFNYTSIRKITPDGVVSAFAGNGTNGFADGPGNIAAFNLPHGIVASPSGIFYVADNFNHRIRKIQ